MSEPVLAWLGAAGPAPLAVVTLGNAWRGDDGLGPWLAGRLAGRLRPGCALVDAGERPEDAWPRVTALKPGRVAIVDAADFGGQPGEARVLTAAEADEAPLSTHRFPVAALAALIESDTGAPVRLIGVQVADARLGADMTAAVRETAEALAACLEADHA